jgi:hypothetical protein
MLVSTLLRLMMFATMISAVPSPQSEKDLDKQKENDPFLSPPTQIDSEDYDYDLDHDTSENESN